MTRVTVDGWIAPATSASKPRVRAFHARGSSVMCLLSSVPFRLHTPPVGLVICGLAPHPHRASLPHTSAWVLALMQRYSLRSLTHYRPHVSISETLLSALASCGIPPDTPCGWHLLMSQHESTGQVTPFPVSIARILRAVLSTGFLGSAHRSVPPAAGALSLALWLQRFSLLRWLYVTMAPHTFACAAHRCLRDGIPG